MYEKRIKLLIWVFVICLIGSTILTFLFAGKPVSFAVDSCMTKDSLYTIDDNGKKLSIIKTDKAGKIEAEIKSNKIKGDKVTAFDYIIADGDKVYVYKIVKEIKSNQVISEEILLCDFKKEKLEAAWTLPVADNEIQNNFSPTVQRDQLYFFTVDYDTNTFNSQAVLNHIKPGESKVKKEAYVNYDIGISFTDFFYSANKDIIFTTPEGKIFKGVEAAPVIEKTPADEELVDGEVDAPAVEEGAMLDVEDIANQQMQEGEERDPLVGAKPMSAEQIYPAENGAGGTMTGFTSDGKNTIYFMDLASNKYRGIDLKENKDIVVELSSYLAATGTTITISDLKNTRFQDEKNLTAFVTAPTGKTALGVFTENGQELVYKYKETGGSVFLKGVVYFIFLIIAWAILYILWELFLMLTKGKVPIVTKVIGICVPVVIVSVLVLQALINSMFVSQTVNNQYKELFLISSQQGEALSSQLISEIDMKNPYNDVYYYELRGTLNSLPSNSDIYSTTTEDPQKVYDFGYHWLYKVNRGKLVSMYTGQNYINVPIEYYYDDKTADMFYEALSTKKTIKGSFRDVGGEWIVLAIPVLDDKGSVIAVMETGTTKASLEYAVKKNTEKINIANLAIMGILIALLSILMVMCLSPLRRLKQSVNSIIRGDLGVQTSVKGRDEVAEIGQVFNQMSTSIRVSVNELQDLNEGYYKFVPSKMFTLLKKSSVTDVKLGDQVNTHITILTFNTSHFDKIMSTLSAEEMFKLINRIYSTMVPIVVGKGGVVDKFEGAGLVAFYTGNCEEAIDTVVSVSQSMEIFNAMRAENGEEQLDMTAGISYGPVMLGIVGHQERLAATTISEHTNLSGFLRRISAKYGAKVLTTGTAVNKIEKFEEKYNSRYIGFISIRTLNETEKLYDIFDGDNEEMKLLKRQTKDLFERGVELYCAKDFYEARLVFIEVLKQNRNDKAAKEYLYRCDKNYQNENQEQIEIFIEKY